MNANKYFGINPDPGQKIIALAGNPNVGKSTVFNALTGLRQHTGNWPGKTVDYAQGQFTHRDQSFLLIDLPGAYSILSHTLEEQIARNFLCFAKPDATLIVLDATCLERNLNLALQVMEITPQVVVCVNLIDEARKKAISIDFPALETELGVPVVAASARQGLGLARLKETLYDVTTGQKSPSPRPVTYSHEVEAAIDQLYPRLQKILPHHLNPRWVALRLLDGDHSLLETLNLYWEEPQ